MCKILLIHPKLVPIPLPPFPLIQVYVDRKHKVIYPSAPPCISLYKETKSSDRSVDHQTCLEQY